jgi:hypothetical protein
VLVNLCPHPIVVRSLVGSADLVLPVAGLARVSTRSVEVESPARVPVHEISFGEVTGLPEPSEGTTYVVSLVVLQACPDRRDLVAPGTGPNDEPIRNPPGHPRAGEVVAVTRFVRLAPPRPRIDELEATRRTLVLSERARDDEETEEAVRRALRGRVDA